MIRSSIILFVFLLTLMPVQAQDETLAVEVKTPSGSSFSASKHQAAFFRHYVGEVYGGGIVFSVWKDSIGVEHGLIASLVDVSKGMVWNTYEKTTEATSLDDGANNTKLIVDALENCSICAAGMCHQFKGGGFEDWYLPASWELFALSQKIHVLNAVLNSLDGEEAHPFTMDYYWSSTEGSPGSAWRQNFSDNNQKFYYHKYSRSRLRAIRRF